MPKRKYCIFVASTTNYIGYFNALINSIYKRKLYQKCDQLDMVLYYTHSRNGETFPKKYIDDLKKFPFDVIPIEMKQDDIWLPDKSNHVEVIKRARYWKLIDIIEKYDVVCHLDCDMFVVSNNFINLFDLIYDTKLIIGCNERFKWDIGPNYFFVDKEEKKVSDFDSFRMNKMICNTPAIFTDDILNVLTHYNKIAQFGRQIKNGIKVGIGDLFCWNIALNMGYSKRPQDIVVFPIETMAQVHQTAVRFWTHIINDNGFWKSYAGDEIYTIHGRVASNIVGDGWKRYKQIHEGLKDWEKYWGKVRDGLKAIQREWYELNYNYILKLTDYRKEDPLWKTFIEK